MLANFIIYILQLSVDDGTEILLKASSEFFKKSELNCLHNCIKSYLTTPVTPDCEGNSTGKHYQLCDKNPPHSSPNQEALDEMPTQNQLSVLGCQSTQDISSTPSPPPNNTLESSHQIPHVDTRDTKHNTFAEPDDTNLSKEDTKSALGLPICQPSDSTLQKVGKVAGQGALSFKLKNGITLKLSHSMDYYKDYDVRLESFNNEMWLSSINKISKEFAESGLFCLKYKDFTCCCQCHTIIWDWDNEDNIANEHTKYASKSCPYILIDSSVATTVSTSNAFPENICSSGYDALTKSNKTEQVSKNNIIRGARKTTKSITIKTSKTNTGKKTWMRPAHHHLQIT